MSESLNDLLLTKAQQVRNAAEILIDKTRDWQVIKQYMCNRVKEIKLTATQEKKKERYQYIYNQLVSGKYSDHEVITQVMKFFSIEQSQAYEDMNCSKEIYNSVININKIFELKLELQLARDYKRKCIEVGDFKSAAIFQKNIVEICKLLPYIEENPGELFEGHVIEAVFDPSLLGAPAISKKDMEDLLKRINEKRNKKIDFQKFIQDLPFVEVKENDSKT